MHAYRRLAWLAPSILAFVANDAQAQAPAGAGEPDLPVVRCDPVANTCVPASESVTEGELLPSTFTAQGDRAALLLPDSGTVEVQLDDDDYRVLIPGCVPSAPGMFQCQTEPDFQHCRTLMYSNMVYSCRLADPFRGLAVDPIAAGPADYRVSVESNARLRVELGRRGFGQTRGEADVELEIDTDRFFDPAWCLARSRFLFRGTGKEGGLPAISEPAACDEPLSFSFRPHEDDVLRAIALCDQFAAWGEELEDKIDIVVAGLFELGSDDAVFRSRYGGASVVVAPWLTVSAPLRIDCRS